MKKITYFLVVFLLTILFIPSNSKVANAAGSPLQISPLHTNGNSPCNVFYSPSPYSFTYNGGSVKLSSQSDGTGNIYTDDKIDIQVTRPDNTTATFSKNYGNGNLIVPTTPQDITALFKTGTNSVKVTMTDLFAPYCNSSSYWIVETSGGGGGSGPSKPIVLPRSNWHGDDSGVDKGQTPNHIVIHHTASTNDPGSVGTLAREIQLALKFDALGTIGKAFNPVSILSSKDSNYSSIRNTWTGQIWLEWQNHKLKGYGDIAYHFLVDPQGNIYEGRWKGSQQENVENKGSSVGNANTGIAAIAALGRYGIDPGDNSLLVNAFDGGVAEPTSSTIQSTQSLINWLSSKYGISKNGMFQLPATVDGQPSCKLPADQCFVNNIAGHRDFSSKTLTDATVCPGDNLYKFLTQFREQASFTANGTVFPHKNPFGLLIGGFSPIILGIVDPSGNRLGIDPANGQYATNIANGVYGKLSLFDDQDQTETPYWLHIPSPTSGVYKIDVVGTGSGSFTLATEDLGSTSARAMKGSTTNGAKDNYQIIYSTTNPNQIELFHDTVPPVTTGTMTCSRDMNGTCRSAATVKLNATDTGTNGDPASGVLKIECSYDNKTSWQQCGDVNGAQIVINKNGKTSFWYRSTDRVLNVEAPKYTGIIDVAQFVSIADTTFNSNSATTLITTGIAHSNGSMSFVYNTTARLDILNYISSFTQSGNTTFTVNQKSQVSQTVPVPSYPLSFYKTKCTNYLGSVTLWDTSTVYNKCIYATGNVTLNTTGTSGKLSVISEGFIYDNSTNANLQAWDTTNGILFYSAKGYTANYSNGAKYTGVIYAPTTQINAGLSNATLNGGLYSKAVNFNGGTSLTAIQAAGFPPTTYPLPL